MDKILINKIVSYCETNRISTTEVADALGKAGVLKEISPLNRSLYKVGKIRTLFASSNSNYEVHKGAIEITKDDVVIIFTYDCENRAIIGDLIAKYILFYREAAAIVVCGLVRDAGRLIRENYPIWSTGVTPLGCFNSIPETPFPSELKAEIQSRYDGGVAICDDGGVTVIEKNELNTDILRKLEKIELQEDLWSFCLNTLKWNTFQIVCEKEYLKSGEVLPQVYLDRFHDLEF